MNKILKWLVIPLIVVIIAFAGYFLYQKFIKAKQTPAGITKTQSKIQLTIPEKILNNKFGFLSGGVKDIKTIKEYGAAWVRPHPGPFLWDAMQDNKDSQIDFVNSDEVVTRYSENELGIVATIWPFAEWDQKNHPNYAACRVSDNDEFLPKNDKKGRGDYLPYHRGNPYDWASYQNWVMEVVERYDGDGNEDMPNLKIPIKYWEVMNEPDLESPEGDQGSRLDFYKGDASDYAQLLIKTSEAIRKADSEAEILIAGAAGGNNTFLDFYRSVFKNKKAIAAFDIGNVHCISNDSYDSFNVEPYKKMLAEFGVKKPIWVTEAEAFIYQDAGSNATQTFNSVRKALSLGAQRIFFTRYEFKQKGEGVKPPLYSAPIKITIKGEDPRAAYQKIIGQ